MGDSESPSADVPAVECFVSGGLRGDSVVMGAVEKVRDAAQAHCEASGFNIVVHVSEEKQTASPEDGGSTKRSVPGPIDERDQMSKGGDGNGGNWKLD